MDPVLQWARKNQPALIRFIRDLGECESPTNTPEAVTRCATLVADSLSDIAAGRLIPNPGAGHTYICEFNLPGKATSGRILALAHADTVWPIGTLRTMKFRRQNGR